MATTEDQSLPYLLLTDPPDISNGLKNLAEAVEPKLVRRYASATDRSTRMGSPAKGAWVWLDDPGLFYFYDGSAWQPLQSGTRLAFSSLGGTSSTSGVNPGEEVLLDNAATFTLPVRRHLTVLYSLRGHSESDTTRGFQATLRRKSGTGVPGISAGTFVKECLTPLSSGVEADCYGWASETLASGTYTYGMGFTAFGGTGHKTGTDGNGNPTPAEIAVFDAGPA